MSSNVFRDAPSVVLFNSMIQNVPEGSRAGGRKSGAKAVQAVERNKAQGYDEGFQNGRAEGYERGIQEGRRHAQELFEQAHGQELEQFAADLQQFVENAQSAVDFWTKQAERKLAALALEIARRALASELQMSQESVVEIARQAIAEVTHGSQVRVRANPFGSALVDARRDEVLSAASNIRDLEVIADPAIKGGCVIETDAGLIDARVETYLARIAQGLEEAA